MEAKLIEVKGSAGYVYIATQEAMYKSPALPIEEAKAELINRGYMPKDAIVTDVATSMPNLPFEDGRVVIEVRISWTVARS